MNVLSLFDGMSCGQMALQNQGITVDNYFSSEVKKTAIQLTQSHFPNTIQLGDVQKINKENLPTIDLLIGGSPCQNFSSVCSPEKRLGLAGEQSSLFFEYYRLLTETNPTYFLLENVGSMQVEDQIKISEIIGVEPIAINSGLVSAQGRARLYWTNIPHVTIPQDKGIMFSDILTEGYTPREKSLCLLTSSPTSARPPHKVFRRHRMGLHNLLFKDESHWNACEAHWKENFKKLSAKQVDEKMETTPIDVSVYEGVRVLTREESEQLQTVPVGWTNELSLRNAFDLLGDGWTVDIISHIFRGI